MKLSKLYSNAPDIFVPVIFNAGLNVVLAEIRMPENRDKDTHNLGKTTLGIVLDFCLLSGKAAGMFLFKHESIFGGFTFFLEVEIRPGEYVTIRRNVAESSKISFKRSSEQAADYSSLDDREWDHWAIPFDRARTILDGLLDLSAVRPWGFRKGLGYLLRTQKDYDDVFQLRRFAGVHADWKPFIAHILGFDSEILANLYRKELEVSDLEGTAKTVKQELGGSIEDLSKIEGLALIKVREIESRQSLIDEFDFRTQDKAETKAVVSVFDDQIAALNEQKYSLSFNRKRVVSSIEDGVILFDPARAAELFDEVGILFDGQIKKDFQQLIDFNKAITDERREYLQEEKSQIDEDLKRIASELNRLGKMRAEALSFLKSTDVFKKYKDASDKLVELRTDLVGLNRQRSHLKRLQELRAEIRIAAAERTRLEELLELNIESVNSTSGDGMFEAIRLYFDSIVLKVIDRHALITVSLNAHHHPEFTAELLDDGGTATSADAGHSYKKLLCVAFDLAVLRAHLASGFPEFVYHDGVFESLDGRKKSQLVEILRDYSDYGIQQIVTLIDDDMPRSEEGEPLLLESDVVLRLHDADESGRIFRMQQW